MNKGIPEQIDPSPWLERAHSATERDVLQALGTESPTVSDLAALLSPTADNALEQMAQRALQITRRHFGRTISLYVPLYLSDYCSGGCVYCGFAADRRIPRHRLEREHAISEMDALKAMGYDEILLLTGERTPQAELPFLLDNVKLAAERFSSVTIEAFPMTTKEYRTLSDAGCVGMTLYQETFDADVYRKVHRWGPKQDYAGRIDAPKRALEGGLRQVGLGVLLGLADPLYDALALFLHIGQLRKTFWQAGFSVSFPRIRPQVGGYAPSHPVDERMLARIIWAFRICLPDAHLNLSTREGPAFRDGMAGVGISKMSAASRTTVGGYTESDACRDGQFTVSDDRDTTTFCAMLRTHNLEPVFKNWDAVYRNPPKPDAKTQP